MNIAKTPVTVTIVVLIVAQNLNHIFAHPNIETPEAKVQEAKPKCPVHRITTEEDIKYWDIDDDKEMPEKERSTIKEDILKKLSIDVTKDGEKPLSDFCFCPKIFGPVVCDQRGGAHANVCTFLCEKRRLPCDSELTAQKILVRVSPGEEVEICKS